MATVYISLGSNLGNRLGHLRKAAALLEQDKRITRLKVSSCYETEPQEVRAQPKYLNAVARLATQYSDLELLKILQGIEAKCQRKRGLRFGPRTLDLDLLVYGRTRKNSRKLKLPHPRMAQRRFVLVPLKEVARKIWYKGSMKSVAQLLKKAGAVPGQDVVLYKRNWN